MRAGRFLPAAGAFAAACLAGAAAQAQLGALSAGGGTPVQKNQPVYYQADQATYNRDAGLVTLLGHVDIWQGDRELRADRVTYDRNTGVAAATGHVVLLEPNGEVLFSNYAELANGMKDGILRNMQAQLAENGKLGANGARRTNAQINELSRVIYSTCNVCAQHPDEPPLWDIRARSAVQDLTNKRIEYRDAMLDFYGVPVMYFPYFTNADPSVKRASGFLVPSLGQSTNLGPYFSLPYYWVIDGQSDATITPTIAGRSGPALDIAGRRSFNSGQVALDTSIASDQKALQGHIFTKGQFAIDDEWRWGFDINYASSTDYLRDFKIGGGIADLLSSQAYLEGFGQGAYSRVDVHSYQGLSSRYVSANLPYVLPRYEYSYFGEPDALGGRLSIDAGGFNIVRDVGTNTIRGSLSANWERPFTGLGGDLWKVILHEDSAVYDTQQLNEQPSWGLATTSSTAQGMADVAVNLHWPFSRYSEGWGTQIIEPILQVIGSPYGSKYGIGTRPNGTTFVNSLVPNEDSLALEFTDSNLFDLNRFNGIDRLEGGPRAAAAMHGAWYGPGGWILDGLIGQSYRTQKDPAFPTGSGLEGTASDVVMRETITPNRYLDFTARERFDHKNWNVRFADALASAGPQWLRVNAGYIYSAFDPNEYYSTTPTTTLPGPPINEVTAGADARYERWKLGAFVRRNLQTHNLVSAGVSGSWENECAIFSANLYRRYTSLNNDHGASTLLFQITLKTVGTFGYHAF